MSLIDSLTTIKNKYNAMLDGSNNAEEAKRKFNQKIDYLYAYYNALAYSKNEVTKKDKETILQMTASILKSMKAVIQKNAADHDAQGLYEELKQKARLLKNDDVHELQKEITGRIGAMQMNNAQENEFSPKQIKEEIKRMIELQKALNASNLEIHGRPSVKYTEMQMALRDTLKLAIEIDSCRSTGADQAEAMLELLNTYVTAKTKLQTAAGRYFVYKNNGTNGGKDANKREKTRLNLAYKLMHISDPAANTPKTRQEKNIFGLRLLQANHTRKTIQQNYLKNSEELLEKLPNLLIGSLCSKDGKVQMAVNEFLRTGSISDDFCTLGAYAYNSMKLMETSPEMQKLAVMNLVKKMSHTGGLNGQEQMYLTAMNILLHNGQTGKNLLTDEQIFSKEDRQQIEAANAVFETIIQGEEAIGTVNPQNHDENMQKIITAYAMEDKMREGENADPEKKEVNALFTELGTKVKDLKNFNFVDFAANASLYKNVLKKGDASVNDAITNQKRLDVITNQMFNHIFSSEEKKENSEDKEKKKNSEKNTRKNSDIYDIEKTEFWASLG